MKKIDGSKLMMNQCLKHAFLLLIIALSLPSWADSFNISVDRTTVELGETINASFVFNGESNRQAPDFGPLREQFDIVSYFPSYSEINDNGNITKLSTWKLALEPKALGKNWLPEIEFKGLKTDKVEITVLKPATKLAADKDIFLETIVDKSSAYVQEQVIVTYRLYFSVQIEGADPESPQINDVVIRQLDTKQYQRRVDGKLYRVAEVPFALFPQRSGTLVIPKTKWQIRVPSGNSRPSLLGNFGRYEIRQLRSQEKLLRVKPIPDTFPQNAIWLPAQSLTVSDQWSSDTLNELRIGEPITRTIKLSGQGLESAQLPVISSESSSTSLKNYAEPPTLEDQINQLGIKGTRSESAAWVISEFGTYNTPEIRIPWWNTQTDQLEELIIPSTKLSTVNKPYTNEENTSDLRTKETTETLNSTTFETNEKELASESNKQWLVYVLVFTNVASICVIIYLLFNRTLQSKVSSNKKALKKPINKGLFELLEENLKNKDAKTAYKTTNLIAREKFGLTGLSDLKSVCQNEDQSNLATMLATLESALFSKAINENLFSQIAELPSGLAKFAKLRNTTTGSNLLPELY